MKVIIAAGGTGGHIFPGIAVAEAFLRSDATNDLLFVGTPSGMEKRIVPAHGFRLTEIEARPFLGTSIMRKVGAIAGLLRGVLTSIRIIRREKPRVIIGMGGFTCVPVIIAGWLLQVPCFLHEQNVYPGMANRWLSRIVQTTFISFDASRSYFDGTTVIHTGNPVRRQVRDQVARSDGRFAIFVFGGSRGARSINEAVMEMLPRLGTDGETVIYHQTGPEDYERVRAEYARYDVPGEVFPFTDRMQQYYSSADVVVSRAGASTIFELAYFRKAAVLVPYPYAAGGHQWKNARYVERLGGAYLIANEDLNGERLHTVIEGLKANPQLRDEMGAATGSIYRDDAEDRIVQEIVTRVS
jgi:UDP-N-acetylglucosamine--N-acetylmuramyl-(pentapeptide) pyrophosphoryl-undecaprenol N-acetylglucosamine transferase